MKLFRYIFSSFAVIVMAASVSSAQHFERFVEQFNPREDAEDGNRSSDGRIVRGSYLTNQWYDNWAFGASAGTQTLWAPKNEGLCFTPLFEVTATKWMTPSVAGRIGAFGFSLKEQRPWEFIPSHSQVRNENGINMFRQTFGGHIDLMWSITNAFWGYKETRLFNVIPYLSGGLMRLADSDNPYFKVKSTDNYYYDMEFAFGGGILTNVRITNNINFTLDIRDLGLRTAYHTVGNGVGLAHNMSVSMGLSYTIHKWYWVRQSTSEREVNANYQEAKEALAQVQDRNQKLEEANKTLVQNNEVLVADNKALEETRKALEDTRKDLAEANQKVEEMKPYVSDDPVQRAVIEQLRNNPNQSRDELLARIAGAEHVVYFDINVSKVGDSEMLRLDRYIRETHERDPYHVFYLTGSADEGTGNFQINSRLCRERAEGVKRILMRKYGVPESQIVIKATIISHEHEDARLDRCVIMESE